MRAPEFWRADGVLAHLAAPLGSAYAAAARLRLARAIPWRAGVPVVCVGNIVMGGAGKTPLAMALGGELRRRGVAAHFLTRGYGGNETGPVRVDPRVHSAEDVGDEAPLLAGVAPAWLAADRVAGARAAIADSAEAIVMDDGFQNHSLVKDVSVVAVDGGYGFGNGRVFPAGPLREPWQEGLVRADAAVLVGEDRVGIAAELDARLPLYRARVVPAPGAERIAGCAVVAFAGIGRPEKFFATLVEMRCALAATRAFPDHHVYREHEIMEMVDLATEYGARPVTTAKDAARLTPEMRSLVEVVEVELAWEEDDAPSRLLAPVLVRHGARADA